MWKSVVSSRSDFLVHRMNILLSFLEGVDGGFHNPLWCVCCFPYCEPITAPEFLGQDAGVVDGHNSLGKCCVLS